MSFVPAASVIKIASTTIVGSAIVEEGILAPVEEGILYLALR